MGFSEYWILKKGDELSREIADRVESFQNKMQAIGLTKVWAKNRAFYENRMVSNAIETDVIDSGDVGELKGVTFNHYRNIIRHMINGMTANMPAFDVSAMNTDKDSRRAASIGRDLVTYYYKTKRAAKHVKRCLEKAVVYGDGFICSEFDPTVGREITTNEKGRVIREGDFIFDAFSPFDVFYDYCKKDFESWAWVSFRRPKNRYDLAVLFPKQKDQILGLKSTVSDDIYADYLRMFDKDKNEEDDVWIYSTYHKACPSLPKGKYVLTAGNSQESITLYESENPYRESLPIFKLSPSEYMETSFGFTEANILRSAQMILTTAISYLVSNMEMGGLNNVWTPKGATLTVEQITDGLNLIQSDTKPEVVDFFRENQGLVNMVSMCIGTMETLSGQNAVIRGNVKDTPNLKSGIALATVINQAQAYSQGLEASYHELFEDMMTFILAHLKKVTTEERIYEVSGKSKRSAVASYKKEDISGISRVYIERVNPITKTPAGKVEVGMELLKLGQITPEQFFDVVNTGNLSVATESDEKLYDYITCVKEALLSGKEVLPIPGINHRLFIQEIQALLYDYDLTIDPKNAPILKNIVKLVNAHMDFIRNGDEIAALIFGGQPPQPQKIGTAELDPNQLSALPQPAQAPMPMPPMG